MVVMAVIQEIPRTTVGIGDTEIDGPTSVPKSWLIFINLGHGLSQKVGFFLIFEPIL